MMMMMTMQQCLQMTMLKMPPWSRGIQQKRRMLFQAQVQQEWGEVLTSEGTTTLTSEGTTTLCGNCADHCGSGLELG
jgi:hypothetical protein